jgi:hypothetical protein
MNLRFVVAALAAVLGTSIHAQPLPTQAGEFRPSAASAPKAAAVAVRMRLDGAAPARRVDLARPAAAEVRKLADLNGGGGIAAPGRPQFIGFGRDVPAAARKVDLAALTWTTLDGGTRVARIEVTSAGAAGVRVALRLPMMDPDAKVSFAAPGAADALYSVPANTVAQATAQFGEYWSPVIEGQSAAIEIEVPSAAKLGGATLEIARLSHLVVGATASKADEAKLLSDIGDSGSCNIDFKCGPTPQDQVTYNAAAATGKLVFTVESGGTARCSGTLLNDTISSGTPYLFSANHCFQSAYEASTLQVWWFFDSLSCGSLTPADYIVQFGGAKLLGRSQDWDWALLRLNGDPPDSVWFSGWNAASVATSSEVEIFHHPAGDLKKWSRGTSFAPTTVNFGTAAGGGGLFTRIVWNIGTTEGGSSGGALRTFNGSILQVRGGLLGGDALCSNPNGSDYFSQLGAALPLVRQYLTPDVPTPDFVLVVEFYNPVLDHYFMTASTFEIGILDGGNPPGWERTGFTFLAYSGPGVGRSPVCRYYQKNNNSHFYSADPAQCALVSSMFPDWTFESSNVFYIGLPNTTTGACGVGTRAVYRFYHPSVVNHRFPAEMSVANSLSATPGWIPEGYGLGPLYPAMCSPNGI